MTKKAKPIPDGYYTVTPHLIVDGAVKALEFYKKALGAKEIAICADPEGKVMHAEMRIGNSPIMLADEFPEMNVRGPKAFGGSPISIHLYVEDVDALVNQAVAAGATLDRPVKDQFYGDRSGSITDPFGHVWHIATHKEDLTEDEMKKRTEEYIEKQKVSS